MNKPRLNRPILLMLYGLPGSGKTFFSRQISEILPLAHVSGERIRAELFEEPQYDKSEQQLVHHLMDYMSEEFLKAGLSVIYDTNAHNLRERRALRDMARAAGAETMLLWLQIDSDSAFVRSSKRDKRRADDRFTSPLEKVMFDKLVQGMQNPQNEDYIVISGKHTFNAQRDTLLKRLQMKDILVQGINTPNAVKPGMVNLVPGSSGRVDVARRNIAIRN